MLALSGEQLSEVAVPKMNVVETGAHGSFGPFRVSKAVWEVSLGTITARDCGVSEIRTILHIELQSMRNKTPEFSETADGTIGSTPHQRHGAKRRRHSQRSSA